MRGLPEPDHLGRISVCIELMRTSGRDGERLGGKVDRR